MKCFNGFWLNNDLITQLAKNVMSDSSGFNLLLQSKNESSLMHMSSPCPRGWTPGQQGEYVGEYKGELLVSLPRGKGKIQHSPNI